MAALHEIAHLAHVQLHTPVLDQSVEFFTRYLGLTENGSAGDAVFLHAWDDYDNTTIKLSGHAPSGVGRTNRRAASPDALDRRVKEIQASGRGIGWQDGDPGYGPTYTCTAVAAPGRGGPTRGYRQRSASGPSGPPVPTDGTTGDHDHARRRS
jgi:catechol 2,3-dioxygenase